MRSQNRAEVGDGYENARRELLEAAIRNRAGDVDGVICGSRSGRSPVRAGVVAGIAGEQHHGDLHRRDHRYQWHHRLRQPRRYRQHHNILSNASVAGTLDGLAFNGGTVNNSGTISANGAGGLGIDAFAYHVTNSGSIEANGTNGVALLSGGNSDLANTGTISANGADGIGISSTGILNAPSHLRRTGDGDKLRLHWSGKNRH